MSIRVFNDGLRQQIITDNMDELVRQINDSEFPKIVEHLDRFQIIALLALMHSTNFIQAKLIYKFFHAAQSNDDKEKSILLDEIISLFDECKFNRRTLLALLKKFGIDVEEI